MGNNSSFLPAGKPSPEQRNPFRMSQGARTRRQHLQPGQCDPQDGARSPKRRPCWKPHAGLVTDECRGPVPGRGSGHEAGLRRGPPAAVPVRLLWVTVRGTVRRKGTPDVGSCRRPLLCPGLPHAPTQAGGRAHAACHRCFLILGLAGDERLRHRAPGTFCEMRATH